MGAATGRAGRGEVTYAGARQPDPYGPAADPPDVAVSEGYGRCGSLSEGPGRSACTQVMRWVFSSLRGACWAWPGRRARCLAACRAQPAPTPAGAGAVMPALAGARGAGTHATRALWRASANLRCSVHGRELLRPAAATQWLQAGFLQPACRLPARLAGGVRTGACGWHRVECGGSGQGSCFRCSCSGVLHDAPLAWPSCSSWAGLPTACRAAARGCRAGTGALARLTRSSCERPWCCAGVSKAGRGA